MLYKSAIFATTDMETANNEFYIENKVANSGIITLNLEDYFDNRPQVLLDIKPWLFREMIVREKDFREQVKNHNWSQYTQQNLAITCTADAIVPTWAYMLISIAAAPYASKVVFGGLDVLNTILMEEALNKIDLGMYADKRIIVKGCGEKPIPVSAYVSITNKLLPHAKSIMYGEACSNVPLYKKK
jgi:hypothetical protein